MMKYGPSPGIFGDVVDAIGSSIVDEELARIQDGEKKNAVLCAVDAIIGEYEQMETEKDQLAFIAGLKEPTPEFETWLEQITATTKKNGSPTPLSRSGSRT